MNDQQRHDIRLKGYLTDDYRRQVALSIGQQLAQRREQAAMTPEQIEQATGIKASRIRAHERGDYPPKTVTELAAIAEAIGCTIRLIKN